MAEAKADLVEGAWRAMWRADGRYSLARAVERGLTTRRLRLAPLRVLRLSDVGPLVLFNKAPWNGVALSLTRNRLTLEAPVRPVSFEHDPATGRVKLALCFPRLAYSANYVVRSGMMPQSAMRVAAQSLGLGDGDSPNIQLAGQYQDNLLATDNGLTLVGTYWDHNEAYNYAFTNSAVLQELWTETQTPIGSNQDTAFYANQTSSAAQMGQSSPAPVQGVVSSNGYSDYAAHAATMQGFVWTTCLVIASNNPDVSSQFQAAGLVSSRFLVATQNFAAQPMTVPQVMSTVASTPREMLFAAPPARAPWQDLVDARLAEAHPRLAAEAAATQGYRLPLHHSRRGTPGRGSVREELALDQVVLEGQVRPDGPRGCPQVSLDVTGGAELHVDLRLSRFEGPLFDEVSGALGEAHFLRDALGQRLSGALGGSRLAGFVSGLMNLALAGELGPVAS
jgi:hypothetical protein